MKPRPLPRTSSRAVPARRRARAAFHTRAASDHGQGWTDEVRAKSSTARRATRRRATARARVERDAERRDAIAG